MMGNLVVDRISMVGGGRHMRLRLRSGYHFINGIYFSATPETVSIQPGDVVDVAFNPQINEFRGERTVQMNVLDIRPSCTVPCSAEMGGYSHVHTGNLTSDEAACLLPERNILGIIWRYLAQMDRAIQEDPLCLCRKIVRWSNQSLSLGQFLTALDIFKDVGLLHYTRQHKDIFIRLTPGSEKADLNQSQTMQTLLRAKES